MVMALNFWHADFKFVPLEAMRRRPNQAQEATKRLWGILKAFGSSSEEFSVPASGRRSTNLIALLADLSQVITWSGASGDACSRCLLVLTEDCLSYRAFPETEAARRS